MARNNASRRNFLKLAGAGVAVFFVLQGISGQPNLQANVARMDEARTAEFRVSVPPDGERVVNYTVHYSW